ncbi:MAG: OsmC family protein [Promethearchaeota archaeon]
MKNKLISDESLQAYKIRFEEMQREMETEKGNELFVVNMVAFSEQIDNLHVKAKVNNFEIESDGPKDLGGFGKIPGPMPMLLASIANCLEITALLYLSYSNININSIKVKVEANYDKRSALNPTRKPFPGFYDLTTTWYLNTEENFKKVERILNKIEQICPVKGSLIKSHKFNQKIKIIN